MDLTGRVALITGGGTGIGRAVSEQLAEAGAAAVVVNYSRSATEADETVAKLRASGVEAVASQADVADDSGVRAMVEDATRRYGRLDILVNSAGTTVFAPFPDLDALTDEVWDKLLGVNMLGAFYCARAAAPALRAAKGVIVNVSSVAGHRAAGSSLAYGVSKGALLQLTKGLAVSLAPDVRVNAVAPGMVATRWHRDHVGVKQADANARAEAEKVPLGYIADAETIARAIMALIRTDFVTGEFLYVDGGKHLLY